MELENIYSLKDPGVKFPYPIMPGILSPFTPRRLSLAALLFLFLLACSGCDSPRKSENPEVIVLHTGRLRGNIYPLELQLISPLQHYQFIAGYVDQVRKEADEIGARVVLVDLGDSLEGTFASYVTGSSNVAKFFDSLGYNAIMLGNLDNQVSSELLASIDAKILNPFLGPEGQPAIAGTYSAAEIVPAADGLPPIYLIANFYGNTDLSEFPDRFPNAFGNLQSRVEPVRNYREVFEKLGPRPEGSLTLFGWAKFEAPENPPQEFLNELIELGVDVILAQRVYGSNQKDIWSENRFSNWHPPVSQNILRNNGGFTIARIDLRWDEGKWNVLSQKLLPMTANTAPPSSEIAQTESVFAPQILEADRTILELPQGMNKETILREFLRGLTEIENAGIVVYSLQSIRSEWSPGNLRASAVFNALPWTSPLVRMKLTWEEAEKIRSQNPALIFWKRTNQMDSASDWELVTSRYFAGIFSRQLGRSAGNLYQPTGLNEFDYFLEYLQKSKEVLDVDLPAGWVDWKVDGGPE